MLQRIFKSKHGFTLIEVLVAITIGAIALSVIITAALAVQKSGRDGKRRGDLRNIQAALEQYHSDNKYYPSAIDLNVTTEIDAGLENCLGAGPSCVADPAINYLKPFPRDPLDNPAVATDPHYCYKAQISKSNTGTCTNDPERCNYYLLYTKLEGEAPGGATCGGATYNYDLGPDE